MSLRSVRQLREFIVRYSDYDGSSRGVREWIRTHLIDLASKNPQTQFKTSVKRNVHPYLQGIYHNGNIKTICVKNLKPEEIQNYALFLRNQIGRRMNSTGYKRPVLTERPSIQGQWTERMDLIDLQLQVEISQPPAAASTTAL